MKETDRLQMMKTLGLSEGEPVRLTGAKLPKGKMVKIQAQSTDFLQVSDAKAVYVRPVTLPPLTAAGLSRHFAFTPP